MRQGRRSRPIPDAPERARRTWIAAAAVEAVFAVVVLVLGDWQTAVAIGAAAITALGAAMAAERWRAWKAIALDLSRQIAEHVAEDRDAP